jgi:predicted acetyltransferase
MKNMNIQLVRPSSEHKEQVLEFKREFFNAGEYVINGSELLDKMEVYEDWVEMVTKNANPETVNQEWVLTDTFLALDNNKMIGIIELRYELKGFLIDFGNCGYSVRPSERRKGYATKMLEKLLEVAWANGMKELHLSVERSNEPSVKTIIRNKGVYERSFEHEGEMADVYVITNANTSM